MQRWSRACSVLVAVVMVGAFTMAGCAGKRVAASSADASSTTKEKGAAPVESVSPERMATVPDERRSTTETARAPFDAPAPAGGETGGTPPAGGGISGSTVAPPAAAPAAPTADAGLRDIFFDFDQYAIRRDAEPALEANAAWIKNTPGKSILIEGHCDERGTEAYNLVLGEKRARAAKRYLEDLGVQASRLKITSFGEIRPFCHERNEACYQLNRRAHFVVQ